MNILFIGDISGRPGREAVSEVLPRLKKEKKIDFVIANAENSAGGRGVTRQILHELNSYGIDYFTAGEHVWGYKDFLNDLQDESLSLVRPANYEASSQIPGKGFDTIDLGKVGKIVIISLIGQVYMREPVRSPFWVIDEILDKYKDEWNDSIIIIDFHAEASSEKISLGHYISGRVTALFGTHTHVGTVDTRIINNTGFVTDVGMAGPYDASLWVKFEDVIHNFKYPYKKSFTMEDTGRRIFNSVLIEVSDENIEKGPKICEKIKRIDIQLD